MINVMVIDDHKMFRDAIVDKLNSRENVNVIYETGSGKDAIIKSKFLVGLPYLINHHSKQFTMKSKSKIALLTKFIMHLVFPEEGKFGRGCKP